MTPSPWRRTWCATGESGPSPAVTRNRIEPCSSRYETRSLDARTRGPSKRRNSKPNPDWSICATARGVPDPELQVVEAGEQLDRAACLGDPCCVRFCVSTMQHRMLYPSNPESIPSPQMLSNPYSNMQFYERIV